MPVLYTHTHTQQQQQQQQQQEATDGRRVLRQKGQGRLLPLLICVGEAGPARIAVGAKLRKFDNAQSPAGGGRGQERRVLSGKGPSSSKRHLLLPPTASSVDY
ncbi:hypothetical protein L209DRAFT_755725 [Thermothelomyces heterothallicus CBS 203.75]